MSKRATVTRPSPAAVSVALRLEDARKAAPLTQAELAAGAGISQPQWSQIVNGQKELTLGVMLKACEVLGIDPATVVGD